MGDFQQFSWKYTADLLSHIQLKLKRSTSIMNDQLVKHRAQGMSYRVLSANHSAS